MTESAPRPTAQQTGQQAAPPTVRGIRRSDWAFVARRAWHGFMRHRGIDSAAALTFFSSLALFPMALAVVSAYSIGNGREDAAAELLQVVGEVVHPSTVETIREPLTQLFTVSNPGIALALGIVLSLWSLSSYATAFGRAVNTVYEVQEGRQIWKFRGLMLVLAAFLAVVFAGIAVLLLTTNRVAQAVGMTEPWLTAWAIARWPILAALFTLLIAVLYYVTPNVRHDRMRWVSFGALFAIIAWGAATTAFAFYVSTVQTYDRVYGWLGGGLALLIWLYLTNLVLVLGAEVDAELVRVRQLSAGIRAEEVIQLPLRDSRRNLMLARQRAADEAQGRAIRERGD